MKPNVNDTVTIRAIECTRFDEDWFYYHDMFTKHRLEFAHMFRESRKFTDVSFRCMLFLHEALRCVSHLKGNVAECGVNRGGTASVIANTMRVEGFTSKLFLFDSFEGMPEVDPRYDNFCKKGDYNKTSLEHVQGNLAGCYHAIEYVKGFLEETLPGRDDGKFSFVHVDVDLYSATKCAFEHFYPLMLPGGVMVDDDYNADTCLGAKKAVDDFVATIPEELVKLPSGQVMIVKA